MIENESLKLIPSSLGLAEELADYYQRNREFLKAFEPKREEAFFTAEYQRNILKQQVMEQEQRRAYYFYIKLPGQPDQVIGSIGLSNVVWGVFCSAFLGYKLDKDYLNRGHMTMAVGMVTEYAFRELNLHRIEANVMPSNKPSLKVLENNKFENEGLAKYYLNINGVWEDHIHMVKINFDMHKNL